MAQLDGTTIYTPYPNYEEVVNGSSTTVRAYYMLGGQAVARPDCAFLASIGHRTALPTPFRHHHC
jgi:hypothetical protein